MGELVLMILPTRRNKMKWLILVLVVLQVLYIDLILINLMERM